LNPESLYSTYPLLVMIARAVFQNNEPTFQSSIMQVQRYFLRIFFNYQMNITSPPQPSKSRRYGKFIVAYHSFTKAQEKQGTLSSNRIKCVLNKVQNCLAKNQIDCKNAWDLSALNRSAMLCLRSPMSIEPCCTLSLSSTPCCSVIIRSIVLDRRPHHHLVFDLTSRKGSLMPLPILLSFILN
jgi:hypothetical protein